MSEQAVIEQSQPAVVPEPAASPEPRAATEMIERITTAPGGNEWDGEKSEWVNGVERAQRERDDKGRFAKVRESLEQSQKKSEYVRLLREGAVEPTEEMDAETWAAVRQAQIDAGTNKITVPEFPVADGENADSANESPAQGERLTPEEEKHFTDYNSMLANVAAKMAIDGGDTKAALDGLSSAHERYGVSADAINYMGHCIADCANAHEVFLTVGKKPEVVATLSRLAPQRMRAAVLQLSAELGAAKVRPRGTKAPPPPDPVGARPVVATFDANDENMSADEWREKREAQLAAKRKR